jgi:hypothetical protein
MQKNGNVFPKISRQPMTIVSAPGRRIGPTIAFAIDTAFIGQLFYTGWPKNLVFLALHYASRREIKSHKKSRHIGQN